ncbi:MAG: hypothetical protein ACXAC6_05635 [Candidatus Hodarchaeales archaeon]|jgi:hypothetical protein
MKSYSLVSVPIAKIITFSGSKVFAVTGTCSLKRFMPTPTPPTHFMNRFGLFMTSLVPSVRSISELNQE